jgi:hypothetical protein
VNKKEGGKQGGKKKEKKRRKEGRREGGREGGREGRRAWWPDLSTIGTDDNESCQSLCEVAVNRRACSGLIVLEGLGEGEEGVGETEGEGEGQGLRERGREGGREGRREGGREGGREGRVRGFRGARLRDGSIHIILRFTLRNHCPSISFPPKRQSAL